MHNGHIHYNYNNELMIYHTFHDLDLCERSNGLIMTATHCFVLFLCHVHNYFCQLVLFLLFHGSCRDFSGLYHTLNFCQISHLDLQVGFGGLSLENFQQGISYSSVVHELVKIPSTRQPTSLTSPSILQSQQQHAQNALSMFVEFFQQS
ncbi:hypothetical protein AQUCO_03500115v1 [Aquilegia coerulea]|uniref:Uncharacterized protein n=1 Tax=Aquilegia coerulea TaxID=218851 RepID=A0A2G5CW75_AQUCA|nr:hypothetical protein AQUCO_03500115v1 [Aquilegia coerulea]